MSKIPPEFYNLSERLLNSGSSYWGNLGYWKSATDYSSACEDLAHQLAEAVSLNENSRIFDAGFGCGDQLLMWLKHYKVKIVSGINYSNSQTFLAKKRLDQAGFYQTAQSIIQGDVANLNKYVEFNKASINAVLALDCAYHFPSRKQFFKDSFSLLKQSEESQSSYVSQPVLGLTDIILAHAKISWGKKILLNTMLTVSNIPKENIVTLQQYECELKQAGFKHIQAKDISDYVFDPFGCFIKKELAGRGEIKENLKGQMSARIKYKMTAIFLHWAYRHNILRYVVIKASPNGGFIL